MALPFAFSVVARACLVSRQVTGAGRAAQVKSQAKERNAAVCIWVLLS